MKMGIANYLAPVVLVGAILGAHKVGLFSGSNASTAASPATSRKVSSYNNYVDAYNDNLSDFAEDLRKVVAHDPDSSAKKSKRIAPGWAASSIKRTIDDLEAAITKDDVETQNVRPHAEKLVASLKVFSRVVPELENYYELKNYKDDDNAKGKQLWAELVPAAQSYVEAFSQFNRELTQSELLVKERSLKLTDKNTGTFAVRNYTLQSLKLLQGGTENLGANINAIDEAFTHAKKLADADPSSRLSSFFDNIQSHYAAVKEVSRALQKGEKGDKIGKNMRKVASEYNDMIKSLNTFYSRDF